MIQYIYSRDQGKNTEKYYQIHGSMSKEDTIKIINYIDLIGMPLNEALYIPGYEPHQIRTSLTQYGSYYLPVERSIIKDMKRLGLLEIEYKYKKKDKV